MAAAALPGNVAAMTQDGQAVTHGGAQAVAAARAHGARTMFTLSGGHVFPVYDGAVKADPPMPILDVRHEQTAVFAAEATARLTRTPGFAVLTAGPGVTNGISAITTAHFNGSQRGRARRPRARLPLGLGQPAGVRSPGSARPDHQAGLDRAQRRRRSARLGQRGVRARRAPGTAARSSSTSAWRRCSGRPSPASQPGRRARPARAGRPAPAAAAGQRRRTATPAASPRIAELLAAAARPGARARLRRLARRGRAGRPAGRRGTAAPGDRERPGPGHPPGRPRAAGHPGPVAGVRRGRPGHRGRAHRSTSGSATASTAAGTAPRPPRSSTSPTRPARSPRHCPLAASRRRRPDRVLHRPDQRSVQRTGLSRPLDARTGCPGSPRRAGQRSRPTPACWPATPSRSTRCGSTASSRRCSTPTRS